MKLIVNLCASVAFLLFSWPMLASASPNILIMGEDADKDTVPRNSRVFNRVVNSISNQLHDIGFDVFDESAVTLGKFKQGRVRRTDAELFDIARSIQRPPIDVVVVFKIYASAKATEYNTKIKTRVEGRMLNVGTGQRLGNFEMQSPQEWLANEAECNRECILETVGDYSSQLANDVGAVLAEKLRWMVEGEGAGSSESQLPNAYSLTFDGFTPEEVLEIEEYLVIYSGYQSYRPTYSSGRRAEYWYQSTITPAKLTRNLKKTLTALDLRGVVQASGNTFSIKKISLRNKKPKSLNDEAW